MIHDFELSMQYETTTTSSQVFCMTNQGRRNLDPISGSLFDAFASDPDRLEDNF